MLPRVKAINLFETTLRTLEANLSIYTEIDATAGMFGRKNKAVPVVAKITGLRKTAFEICRILILVEINHVANPLGLWIRENECSWHQYTSYWAEVMNCLQEYYNAFNHEQK